MTAAIGRSVSVRSSLVTLRVVKTVVLGPRPHELEAFLARRKALGLDLHDEVWEGVYHVAPAAHPSHGFVEHELAVFLDGPAKAAGLVATGSFNLGTPDDYRVPDQGYHRALPGEVWVPTAAVVAEVVSPDDETWAKFDFYAAHGVEEILIADPRQGTVRCFRLTGTGYVEGDRSEVLDVAMDALTAALPWPPLP